MNQKAASYAILSQEIQKIIHNVLPNSSSDDESMDFFNSMIHLLQKETNKYLNQYNFFEKSDPIQNQLYSQPCIDFYFNMQNLMCFDSNAYSSIPSYSYDFPQVSFQNIKAKRNRMIKSKKRQNKHSSPENSRFKKTKKPQLDTQKNPCQKFSTHNINHSNLSIQRGDPNFKNIFDYLSKFGPISNDCRYFEIYQSSDQKSKQILFLVNASKLFLENDAFQMKDFIYLTYCFHVIYIEINDSILTQKKQLLLEISGNMKRVKFVLLTENFDIISDINDTFGTNSSNTSTLNGNSNSSNTSTSYGNSNSSNKDIDNNFFVYLQISSNATEINKNISLFAPYLIKVSIPQSINRIISFTFSHFTNLKSITIPPSITIIERRVFEYCSQLEEVVLPSSITNIQEGAFFSCTNLKEINLPSSIKSIGESSFSYCTSLEKVTIPSSVVIIHSCAFSQCSSLKEVVLNDSLRKICDFAFENCVSLSKINFPLSLVYIEKYAFDCCLSLDNSLIPPKFARCSLEHKSLIIREMDQKACDLQQVDKWITNLL